MTSCIQFLLWPGTFATCDTFHVINFVHMHRSEQILSACKGFSLTPPRYTHTHTHTYTHQKEARHHSRSSSSQTDCTSLVLLAFPRVVFCEKQRRCFFSSLFSHTLEKCAWALSPTRKVSSSSSYGFEAPAMIEILFFFARKRSPWWCWRRQLHGGRHLSQSKGRRNQASCACWIAANLKESSKRRFFNSRFVLS